MSIGVKFCQVCLIYLMHETGSLKHLSNSRIPFARFGGFIGSGEDITWPCVHRFPGLHCLQRYCMKICTKVGKVGGFSILSTWYSNRHPAPRAQVRPQHIQTLTSSCLSRKPGRYVLSTVSQKTNVWPKAVKSVDPP